MSSSINMASEIWILNDPSRMTLSKTKPKGHGSMLGKMQPDHTIRSAVTASKLPLRCVNLKKKNNNKKEKFVVVFDKLAFFCFVLFFDFLA